MKHSIPHSLNPLTPQSTASFPGDDFHLTLDRDISLAQELNLPADDEQLLLRAEACALSPEKSPLPEEPTPEENLAQAIVMQAVSDWRLAVQRLRLSPEDHSARALMQDAEAFFRSRWFRTLIDLDGEELLRRLRESERILSSPAKDDLRRRLWNERYSARRKTRRKAG